MDAVEILLLGVVGCSVIVFLVLENLDSNQNSKSQRRAYYDSQGESWLIEKSVKTIDDQEERESVGAEKEVAFERFKLGFQGIEEQKEKTEDPVDENRVKSGSRSGVSGEDGFFDDWEGIERTELERIFGEAVNFVSCNVDLHKIDGDLMLELYGLQKVALEGSCHGSQPIALKVSARSKWNAWQKLGNMSRETAMEKYVDILSKTIPKWKGETAGAILDTGTSEDES